MPHFSRVLRPASKRKPPIKRRGSSSDQQNTQIYFKTISRMYDSSRVEPQVICRRKSGSIIGRVNSRPKPISPNQPLASIKSMSAHPQHSILTFPDLYPVFRRLLEARYHSNQYQKYNCHRQSTLQTNSLNFRRLSSFNSYPSTNELPPYINWNRGSHFSSKPVISSCSPYSTQSSLFKDSQAHSQTLLPSRNILQSSIYSISRTTCSPLQTQQHIPSRSISRQYSARSVDEIPDLRIPEEFLPIDSQQQIVLPPSPQTFKKWVTSQIHHSRELIQKQNYMQALLVIDKAKEHDYMQEFSRNPALTSSATKRHIQDLYLVEYCCRLICAHENQPGNIDMIETLGYLNSTILKTLDPVQFRRGKEFKTTFHLSQDHLLDYTLAIVTKYWVQLSSGINSHSMQRGFSKDQVDYASLVSPFLNQIIERRLFTPATPIWQDLISANEPGLNSRKSVLEICFANDNPTSGMHWIWLWARRDQADWLDQWNQPDLRHWLFSKFVGSGRADWLVDLYRLSSKAAGRPRAWVQSLLDTKSNISNPPSLTNTQELEDLFHFLEKDDVSFEGKKEYYGWSSEKHLDRVKSWFLGLHDPNLIIAQRKIVAEQQLWREMAMIAVLNKDITKEDVIRSLFPKNAAATIGAWNIHLPSRQPADIASSSYVYGDILIDYIDEKVFSSSNIVLAPSSEKSLQVHEGPTSNEALVLLKRTIQGIMFDRQHSQDALISYRNLLCDVIQNSILRSNDLDLVSQTVESRFSVQYGNHIWSKTAFAIKSEVESGSLLRSRKKMTEMPEIYDFTSHYIQPMLAKICASKISIGNHPMTKWQGKLSEWVVAISQVSPITSSMATSLQLGSGLKPNTFAYKCTMQTLLDSQQLDLAADLHSNAYNLSGSERWQNHPTQPTPTEVGILVNKLATSNEDPNHLERAQWIADHYIERERILAKSGNKLSKDSLVDIHLITPLVGAWSSRAQFSRAHDVIRAMWDLGIQPNMFLYNTILKSLMDITPFSRPRRATVGMGKRLAAREQGRQIMVKQLLMNKESRKIAGSKNITLARTVLDEGWDMLQEIIVSASVNSLKKLPLPDNSIDSPSMLKKLIVQSTIPPHGNQVGEAAVLYDGRFRPDAYTFSILLHAYAKRGEIESIPGLFVDMKNLEFEPDAVICSMLANAFSKKGDLMALDRVVYEARVRNLDVGLYLANIVLNCLVEENVQPSKIKEALDSMISGDYGVQVRDVDEDTEIPVHRVGNGIRSASVDSNLPKPSLELGDGIDAVTLTTLIKYHTQQNDIDASMDILKLMTQAGFVPDARAYILIISASIRKQNITAGLEAVRLMRVYSNLFPDAKVWKGLLRCAINLCPLGERRKKKPSKNTNDINNITQSAADRESISPTKILSRVQPIISILEELSTVLDEIEAQATVRGKDARSVSREYLLKILTSSWVSISNGKNSDEGERLGNHNSIIANPEVKGKNGLLRRMLSHILESSDESKSRCKQVDELENEQRCEHAIWLVRLLESHGIKLGYQWKLSVVVPRIRSLTQREPGLIMEQLGRTKNDSKKKEE